MKISWDSSVTWLSAGELFALHAPTEIPDWFEPGNMPLPDPSNNDWYKRNEENRYFKWRKYFAKRLIEELNEQ